MTRVFLDVGTNIDREQSLIAALEKLAELFAVKRLSSLYETKPVGMASQPDFYNVSVELETSMTLAELRTALGKIEDDLGRDRSGPKFGPRTIDLDVITFGESCIPEESIPHPQSLRELFVVAPLAELEPEGRHPQTGQTWRELSLELSAGRSGKAAGVVRKGPVADLGLGPKAKFLG